MTHHGLKEGWYKINDKKCYIQLLLGEWNYWTLLYGWKKLTTELWTPWKGQ